MHVQAAKALPAGWPAAASIGPSFANKANFWKDVRGYMVD